MNYDELAERVYQNQKTEVSEHGARMMVKHGKVPKKYVRKILEAVRNEMILCANRGEEFEWKGILIMHYRPIGKRNPLDPNGNPYKTPPSGVWVQLKAGRYLKRAAGHGRKKDWRKWDKSKEEGE